MMFEPKSLKKSNQPQPKAALQLPVVAYIKKKWNVSFNIFTRTVSIVNRETKAPEEFVDVYLDIVHTGGFRISKSSLVDLFESSLFPKVHPVRAFFDSLPALYKHESHIDKLCGFITAKNFGDGHDYQERFHNYFKRWLVAAVACAYGLKHNEVALIFVHKTTFSGKTYLTREALCNQIPELSGYWKQNPMLNDREKFIRVMAQNFFIVLDEFGKLNPRDLNFYKDVISENRLVVKLKSGDRMNSQVDRLANFIGSTNDYDLFTDKTQLRKFCCIELLRIDKSYSKEIDFRQVWAEAVMMVKNGTYQTLAWNEADAREFESYNARYMKQDAQYYILQLFEPTTKEDGVFMTAQEITETILGYFEISGKVKDEITAWHVGKAMVEIGFERIGEWDSAKKNARYGYHVKNRLNNQENTIYDNDNQ